MTKQQPQFIWYDNLPAERNAFGYFRCAFELNDDIRKAELCLFADTFYQLFVNGEFADFGPVRFDPRYPQYDTYDLKRWLRPGRNVLAVKVNYCGHKTFMTIASRAGTIAWGKIEPASGSGIDLATGGGRWRGIKSQSYRYAAKSSFALKAADLYDQAHEDEGWMMPEFDDSRWGEPVSLTGELPWVTLAPRYIPHMSKHDIPIAGIRHALPLAACEERYSFEVPMPHFGLHDSDDTLSMNIAWKTWIYSPAAQIVTIGVYLGDFYVNGVKMGEGIPSADKSMRLDARWPLREGWNDLFGIVSAYRDDLQFYIALPAGKGFIVSAERDPDSDVVFLRTPVLERDVYEQRLAVKDLPFSQDDALQEIGGWVPVRKDDPAESPIFETSWDDYNAPVERLEPARLNGHVFRLRDYPFGFSLLLELDRTHLMLPRLRLRGVTGARIDLTYRDTLTADGKHLLHANHYALGDRAICSRNEIDWLTSQPRGSGLIQLTVRGASSDITLERLQLYSANYPVHSRGWLETSDPGLNSIWRMGERTLAANMEDAYVDTPMRERGMYIRDSIIQYHITLATYGDHVLMKRCLELIGQSADHTGKFRAVYPNTGDYTISDFCLNAVDGFWKYYAMTGDLELVRTYWFELKRNMAWFHELSEEREDRLLDADWDKKRGIKALYGGFHGDLKLPPDYAEHSGVSNVFSCMYLIALRRMLSFAELLDDGEEVERSDRAIHTLEQTIGSFWDERKQCYADNLFCRSHSVHANVFPVLAGVVGEEKLPFLRRHINRDMGQCFVNGYDPTGGVKFSPSFAFYILDGIYRLGMADLAENLMRQAWGWALAQGLKTCPEYFDLSPNFSTCHAWSASPVWHLSKQLLGIHFPVPGNPSQLEICVQAGEVTQVEGAYPHPAGGLIEIKWHTGPDGIKVFDYIRAPEGVNIVKSLFMDLSVEARNGI